MPTRITVAGTNSDRTAIDSQKARPPAMNGVQALCASTKARVVVRSASMSMGL